MAQFSPTPKQAALRFQKQHPEFEGLLLVTGYAARGRGYQVRAQDYRFVIANGELAPQAGLQKVTGRNGRCAGCGQVYTEKVLSFVHRTGTGIIYDLCPACRDNPEVKCVHFNHHAFDASVNITSEQAGLAVAVAQFTAAINAARKVA